MKFVIGSIFLLVIGIFIYLYQRPFAFFLRNSNSVQMEEVTFKDMKLKLPLESIQTNRYNGLGAYYTLGIDKKQLQKNQSPIEFSVNIDMRDYGTVPEDEFQKSIMEYIKDDHVYHDSVCGSGRVEKLGKITSESLIGWQFEADCLGKVYTYYTIGPAQQLYTISMKIEPKTYKESLYRDIIDMSIKSIRFEQI